MWPFAKLRNGFGSHRYVYSPILLDSQELITLYLPSQLPAAGAAPGIYTMPLSLASAMENGDPFATCILSWDAARAAGNYCGWSCELGNGEWRMMRCTCCQGCGSCTIFICQLGEGQWAMEPMDGATIPGKIYSKL